MSQSRFLSVLVLFAVLVVCVPFDLKLMPLMAKSLSGPAKISIVGNSVLSHTSKCDQDMRSLVAMVATEIAQPVSDLSFPGQSLDEGINLAAMSLKNHNVTAVVFPISVFELVEWDTDAVRNYLLFRLLNPSLRFEGLLQRAASPGRFNGAVRRLETEFSYKGHNYPDYERLKTNYMSKERLSMPCPENDGMDLAFVAANLHHVFLEYSFREDNLPLIESLGKYASEHGKSLPVVVLPIDYELMTRLGAGDTSALRNRVASFVRSLEAAGMTVMDLSSILPDSAFSDRWCACGHLLDGGRLAVATQIGQGLSGPVRSVAAREP